MLGSPASPQSALEANDTRFNIVQRLLLNNIERCWNLLNK